jgi:hypothetical protein
MSTPSASHWAVYKPTQQTGKLCYHYCSKHSFLPIRDVLNSHRQGFKVEPNYETATYNWCAKCNGPSVHAAIEAGLSHILFITRYTGHDSAYFGCYFIVGYYEIGWVTNIAGRFAIRAKKMSFVPVEHAYEITPAQWQRINSNGHTRYLQNLRNATQRISGDLLNEILQHLDKHDATENYLREVARLKANHNPFGQIPTGRIFIINVGSNASSPLQSPLFDDGRFEFISILEYQPPISDKFLTYADLRQFNYPDKALLELFSQPPIMSHEKVHDDPEFLTLTHGDNIEQKSNLRDLRVGDFLFFLARLVPYDGQRFNHSWAIFALVGYLEIAECLDNSDDPLFTSPAFIRNAHVRRWIANPASFTRFAIFKGSVNSRRFRYAVPFDREFVEHIPILKVDGSQWDWERTTDLGIIGSNTRTIRMHIDPKTDEGYRRAERFWQYVWKVQKW